MNFGVVQLGKLGRKITIKEIFANNLTANDAERNPKLLLEIMSLINKYNAINASVEMALIYKNLAYKNLEIFDQSPEKKMLLDILEYAIFRQS